MKLISIFVIGVACGFWLGNLYSFDEVLDRLTSDGSTPTIEEVKQGVTDETKDTSPTPLNQEPVSAATTTQSTATPPVAPTPSLTPSQRAVLEKMGINPDTITITPEMISCAYDKLGEARVKAIVDGAEPTTLEMLKVAPCL